MTGRPRLEKRTLHLATRISNTWLHTDDDGKRLLIDTGHALERPLLRRSLAKVGVVGRGDLDAVLLTHRHSDHAGNAAWARKTFDCPVFCHTLDATVLDESRARIALSGRGAPRIANALCKVEDRFPARSAVDETFNDGAFGWGFESVFVGGHTEGSAMLFHRPSGTLFSGDAILAGLPVQRLVPFMRLAVSEYSLDVDTCHRNVRAWLRRGELVKRLCSGHGPVLRRGLRGRLARL